MFTYEKIEKPISIRLAECESRNYQIETQDKIFFLFDLLGPNEGKLIIETYDRLSKRFEKIESTAELTLISAESSPLDYYELTGEFTISA